MFTVRPDGPGVFVVIDMKTGTFVNRFHIPGELVSGPVVANDQCTVVTKQHNQNTGYIIKLPSGYLINRFAS
jgi:hypothetical protein